MTDFLGRLESELVAAARRESVAAPATGRLRARRRVRALVPAAAATAVLAVGAGLALRDASTPVRPADPVPASAATLAGQWRQGAATLDLGRGGWRVKAPGTDLYGGLTLTRGRLVLRAAFDVRAERFPGRIGATLRRRCASVDGVYAAAVAGDRLIVRPVSDPCTPRAAALAGDDWTRGDP